MRIIVPLLGIWLGLSCLAVAAPAAKSGPKTGGDDRPNDTYGSGVITLEQLTSGLQMLQAKKYGIVVRFVLPKGWELDEQGKDPKTGKSLDDLGVYTVLSHRPMPDTKEATDFVFELDIFKQGLNSDIPADTPAEKLPEEWSKRINAFLNTQISQNLKLGFKQLTQTRDIGPKPYGPDTRNKDTWFVPIFFEIPPPAGDKTGKKGARLFTFTSFEGDTIYMLKFLVSKDMVEQHGALLALMLDNCWALTDGADAEMQRRMKEEEAKDKTAGKTKSGGKNN